MANTKIDRIKLNGSDTVYDIDLPPDATPSISSLTIANGLTGAGVFTWSKTAYGETGTTQIADGCRLLLTSGYSTPSIDFSEPRNTTMPYLSSITTTSISFANDSIYPSILWHSNIPNMSGKPFFLTSDLLGKRNYIAQLDNTGKIPAAQIPNNYLDKGTSSTTATQTVYNPVELKKGLIGNGSFVWTGPDESPLDVKFNAKSTQAAEIMGYPAETAVMSLSATPFGPVTLELFTHSTDSDVAIKLNQEGYATTIGVNGITIGGDKNLSWPTHGGALLTNGYFADKNATDPSANDGKIPALEYPGTIPLKFIKPMVSMYASESALPGAVHFSPYYVPDALYVTTDTNSIYRYNKDNESYVKLGPDTSTFLDKGTASTTATQTVYNPVELKKALVAPSIQSTKYTDKFGNQQPLFELGGTHSVNNDVSSGYGSLTLYRDRDGTWDSTSIAYTLGEGLKIGDYGIGGPLSNNGTHSTNYLMTNKDGIAKTSFNGINITSTLTNTDDFVFESAGNGKLHSKMSSDLNGLVRGGWCIDNSKIMTESNFSFDSSTGILTIN